MVTEPFGKSPSDETVLWFAEFMDNLPAGIYRTTLEGKIIFGNRFFANMLGFDSISELVNSHVADLYVNKKDRGNFIRLIIEKGWVKDHPIELRKRNGLSLWCATTAKAVSDDEGLVVYFDGFLREIAGETHARQSAVDLYELPHTINFTLDGEGRVLDIDEKGAESLGFEKNDLLGKPLGRYILPRYREEYDLFINDIFTSEKYEGILSMKDGRGDARHLEFQASLVREGGRHGEIVSVARDMTKKIKGQEDDLARERLQGVLEMAGGVAHNMNQPLMIINNLLNDVLSELSHEDRNYDKLKRVNEQLEKLNKIAKKIGAARKYMPMDYVWGEKIVDIDKTS